MAVYSCCKLIYPQIIIRAADQIVGKKQSFNFGVWGCLYIVYACSRCVSEQRFVVASLFRAIRVISLQPRGPALLIIPAHGSLTRGTRRPPHQLLPWHLWNSSKSQAIYTRNWGINVYSDANLCFGNYILQICWNRSYCESNVFGPFQMLWEGQGHRPNPDPILVSLGLPSPPLQREQSQTPVTGTPFLHSLSISWAAALCRAVCSEMGLRDRK